MIPVCRFVELKNAFFFRNFCKKKLYIAFEMRYTAHSGPRSGLSAFFQRARNQASRRSSQLNNKLNTKQIEKQQK